MEPKKVTPSMLEKEQQFNLPGVVARCRIVKLERKTDPKRGVVTIVKKESDKESREQPMKVADFLELVNQDPRNFPDNPDAGKGKEDKTKPEPDKKKTQVTKEDCYRELPNDIEKEKLDIYRQDLITVLDALDAVEKEKKEAISDFKHRMDTLDNQCEDVRRKIKTGQEMKTIECEFVKDFESNNVKIKRKDTGKIIEDRAMTPQERQKTIDDEIQTNKENQKKGKKAKDKKKK